jgi:hypothetical protein
VVVEKRVLMPHRQNTVVVTYRVRGGRRPVRLELRPAVDFRGYEDEISTQPQDAHYRMSANGDHFVIDDADRPDLPPLRLLVAGAPVAAHLDALRTPPLLYRVEEARGYADRGVLWSPGYLAVDVPPDGEVALVASAESPEVLRALAPAEARDAELERRRRLLAAPGRALRDAMHDDPRVAELVLAADQFLITPAGRLRDRVRAQAVGDEVRTVIAGYHWFTDWGRDTMIALEGLTLTTGRWREAGFIVRTFAQYVRDGLIPNMFPDGSNEGVYHTADATLWFFHAVDRYARVTGDRTTVRQLLPVLEGVARAHLAGTHYGIRADPADGLLTQGAEGYQLTWMDAKMGDWVVTPRRGKAVEVNALWHNALCVLAHWLGEERGAAPRRRTPRPPPGRATASTAASGTRTASTSTTSSTAPTATRRSSGPTSCSRSRCRTRCSTARGGSPWCAPARNGSSRRRAAVARARERGVPAAVRGRPALARRRVPPGHGVGVADRPVGGRVAQGAPGRRRRRAAVLDGLLAHLGASGVGRIAEVFDAEAPFTAARAAWRRRGAWPRCSACTRRRRRGPRRGDHGRGGGPRRRPA